MILASYVPYDPPKGMTGVWVVGVAIAVIIASVLLFFVYGIARAIFKDEGARRFIARSILFVVLLVICLPFHLFGMLVFALLWFLLVRPVVRRSDAMREIKKQIREHMESENYSTGQYVSIYNPVTEEMVATYDPETGMLSPVDKPKQIRINL